MSLNADDIEIIRARVNLETKAVVQGAAMLADQLLKRYDDKEEAKYEIMKEALEGLKWKIMEYCGELGRKRMESILNSVGLEWPKGGK